MDGLIDRSVFDWQLRLSEVGSTPGMTIIFVSCRFAGRSTMALGRNIDRIERNIESIESKITKIFKRPKNREDGSDFDDFWTESIVSTQSIFSKIFERTKNYRIDRIDRIDRLDRSIDRSIGSIDGCLDPEALPPRLQ